MIFSTSGIVKAQARVFEELYSGPRGEPGSGATLTMLSQKHMWYSRLTYVGAEYQSLTEIANRNYSQRRKTGMVETLDFLTRTAAGSFQYWFRFARSRLKLNCTPSRRLGRFDKIISSQSLRACAEISYFQRGKMLQSLAKPAEHNNMSRALRGGPSSVVGDTHMTIRVIAIGFH
jgi:hypothetical protein